MKREAEEDWGGGDRRVKIQEESADTHCASGPRDFVWWSLQVLDRLTPDNGVPTAVVGRI